MRAGSGFASGFVETPRSKWEELVAVIVVCRFLQAHAAVSREVRDRSRA